MSSKISIAADRTVCLGCGSCSYVCPFSVIYMEDRLPQVDPSKNCISCLHCAAACPKNGIRYMGEEAVIKDFPSSFSLHFDNDLKTHLIQRRSYRHFTKEPVNPELLAAALSLADFAPSAKNQHPANWLIVNKPETVQKIMSHILDYVRETGVSPEILSEYEQHDNNIVMGTSSTLIMGYCGANALNPLQDTALALYSAELYLQAKGIGTCWAGYLTRLSNAVPALKELFALPEGAQFTGALMVGHPMHEKYLHIPKRVRTSSIRWMD